MFYFLNCTIQSDKNPLDTSDNAVVHTVCGDENNDLFLTAGRSREKEIKLKKVQYQQLHGSSKWLGCNGYKLSNHTNGIKKNPNQTKLRDKQCKM